LTASMSLGTSMPAPWLRSGQRSTSSASATADVTMRNAVEAVQDLTRGAGADLVMECSGAATAINDAVYATKRGGRICLAAFPHDRVLFDAAQLVRHNIYLYGVRGEGRGAVKRGLALMAQGKISGRPFITHRFGLHELPRALETAEKRLGDAIKVVVKP